MNDVRANDPHIDMAIAQVEAGLCGEILAPQVRAFFDEATFTASYVVSDPATKKAAIIDSVWNFDQASGRTSFHSADAIIDYVQIRVLPWSGSSRPTPMPTISRRRSICRRSLGENSRSDARS